MERIRKLEQIRNDIYMHVRIVPNDVERVKAIRLLTRKIRVLRTRLLRNMHSDSGYYSTWVKIQNV